MDENDITEWLNFNANDSECEHLTDKYIIKRVKGKIENKEVNEEDKPRMQLQVSHKMVL